MLARTCCCCGCWGLAAGGLFARRGTSLAGSSALKVALLVGDGRSAFAGRSEAALGAGRSACEFEVGLVWLLAGEPAWGFSLSFRASVRSRSCCCAPRSARAPGARSLPTGASLSLAASARLPC